ncbi:MAG TPA: autotransporter-associated beta strand repeat-containing protein [Kiritimatiellia bacterium]|nr:autotransporter-associated beta strand repeat-containing protein [Kiritimatiellia bacterium]
MKHETMSKPVARRGWRPLALAIAAAAWCLAPMRSEAAYSGSGTFTLITSTADITSGGYYVFVGGGTANAMASSALATVSTAALSAQAVTITASAIVDPAVGRVWRIDAVSSSYGIYNEAGSIYIGAPAANGMIRSASASSATIWHWTFATTASSRFLIQNVGAASARKLQYNSSSPRFAAYSSASTYVELYKMNTCENLSAVTNLQQQSQYDTRWDSGAGTFDTGGSTELGMWAGGDQGYTVAWKTFRTASATTSSARELQVGDEFSITVYSYGCYYGEIGVSLNDGGSTGTPWANRVSGSRLSVRQDGGNYGSGGGIGSWYAIGSGAGESFTNTPAGSSAANYTVKVKITSSSTFNVDLNGKTKYDWTMAGSPATSARIDAYSIFLNDDRRYQWDWGDNRQNSYWKQTATVRDTGAVEFGGGNGTSTINGLITDGLGAACASGTTANRLYKIGTGTITLGCTTNTYTGGSAAENGILQGSADLCFGAAPASLVTNHFEVWSSGTLQFTGSFALNANRGIRLGDVATPKLGVTSGNAVSYGGSMVGTANWQKVESGMLTLTGFNTNSGVAHITAGILAFGADLAAGPVPGGAGEKINVWSTGTLGFTNVFTLHANRTIELGTTAGPRIWVAPDSTATVNGVIQNSAAWTNIGKGTLILAGNNTFSGNLSITQGVVRVTNANGLGGTGGNTYVANSTASALELAGGITTAAEPLFLNGTGIASGGALRNISGNNTFAGAITLQSTGVRINSDSGILTLNSATAISGSGYNLTFGGASNIVVSSAIGTGAGTVTKDGAGLLTLTGYNTFSGALTISAGAVQLGANGTAGAVTAASIVNNSALAFYRTDDTNYLGVISGTGYVTNRGAGMVLFTNNNSYSGGTVIDAGTIRIAHNNGLGTSAGSTTVASGGRLELTNNITSAENLVLSGTGGGLFGALRNVAGNNTVSGTISLNAATSIGVSLDMLTLSGAISGGNTLNKLLTGTLKLTGASSYSGATTVSAGTLIMNGTNTSSAITVNAAGTLTGSGSVGGLTVAGTMYPGATSNAIGRLLVSSLTMNNGSKAVFQIGNCSDTLDRDYVTNSTGTATINATTTIVIDDDVTSNFNNANAYSWVLIGGGISSAANFSLDSSSAWSLGLGGGGFSLAASGGCLVLTFTPAGGPPTLTTAAFSNSLPTSIKSGGNISLQGGSAVTNRGVCWNTGGTPTIADARTTNGTGTGIFYSDITGLTPGQTYYVRAFAQNSEASPTGYGDESNFVADCFQVAPTSAAGSAISSTNFTANWTALGGAASYQLDVATNGTFGGGAPSTLVSENIQSWTAQASYGSYTEIIAAGTVTMTRCIIQPSASADGPCTVGRVQLKAANGILALPALNTVGSAVFHLDAGASRTIKLQKNVNGGGWTDVTTFDPTTTGAVFSNYVNDANSSVELRLSEPSGAVYVHDIIVTSLGGGSSFVPGFSNRSVSAVSQVVTGLTADTAYYYRVRAVGGGSCVSADSTTQTVTTSQVAPAAPTGLAASDGSSTAHVSNSWNDVSSETGFVLWRNTVDTFASSTAIYTNAANTLTYNDTGATAGQLYYYWVTATNPAGSSAESTSDSGYRKMATVSVTGASDGTSTAHVQVDWTDISGETSYAIYRNTADASGGASFVASVAAGSTTYNDTSATAGEQYYYWVRATNNTSSSQSDFQASGSAGYRKLATVGGVTAGDGASTVQVAVAWTDGAGETSYGIWRHTADDSGSATFLGSAAADATGYDDATADFGQLYYYWVRATNNVTSSQSDFSASDSGYRKLMIVSNVVASDDLYSDRVALQWGDLAGETSYGIWRHTSDASGSASFLASVTAGTTNYDDTSATAGQQYYYWVRATNNTSASRGDFQASGEPGRRASQAAPTVINPTYASVTANGATLGAEISTNGGVALGSRGTVWDTSATPTANEASEGGTATGVFSHARSGLPAGTLIYFRGWASNTQGKAYSADGSFWTVPDAPVLSAASDLAVASFSANWSAATGATNYLLDASASSTFAGFVNGYSARVIGDVTTFSVTGLTAATTYYWRLRAQDSGGISVYSTTNTALTLCAAPIATAATNWTTANFWANWNAVSGATGYRLDVATSSDFSSGGGTTTTVFRETMGTVGGTTTIASHESANGFDNDGYTMSDGGAASPADLRATSSSSGYTDPAGNAASDAANVYHTSTSGDYGFSIAGIDSTGYAYLQLNFGYRKEAAGNNATFNLEWSTNSGTAWNAVTVSNMPAEGDGAGWYMVTNLGLAAEAISANLSLRWVKTGGTAMRVDDVLLRGISAGDSYVPGYSNRSVSATTELVTNLAAGATYYYRVRAENASGASSNSNVITAYTLSAEPAGHAGSFAAAAASASTINLSWTAASAPVDGYLILRRQGADPTGTPTDGTNYALATVFGDATLVNIVTGGAETGTTVSNLTASTQYNFSIVPFNADGGQWQTYNYLTAATIPTANATTFAAEPSANPTAVAFTLITATSFQIGWSGGDGANSIVVVKQGSAVDSNPADGMGYTNNAAFGSGTQLGTGNYVVYIGSGTSVVMSALTAGVTYHVAIYEFNGDDGLQNYRTSDPRTGSQAPLDTPAVTTFAISNNIPGSAVSGGNVTDEKGATVTRRGVCWSTSNPPTIADPCTTNGSGLGEFSATMANLTPGQTYYVRAYATNTIGAGYGYVVTNVASCFTNGPIGLYANPTNFADFTANWSALAGATGYQLDVYQGSTVAALLIDEAFDGGTTPPGGWTFTAIGGTYSSDGNYGRGSPSLQMDATGDAVETPTLGGSPTGVTIWVKGNGTDASSSLLVEGYAGSWSTVSTIMPLPTTGENTNMPLSGSVTKLRFTYTKSAGNLAFDDVIVGGTSNAIAYATGYSNVAVSATSNAVTGLTEGGVYYYRVRGTNTLCTSVNSATGTVTLKSHPGIGVGAALAVYGVVGSTPTSHTFAVTNIGGGALSYVLSTNAAWLTVRPLTGSSLANGASKVHTNFFVATGLSAGTYYGTNTVTNTGAGNDAATNSPQVVQAVLVLTNIPDPSVATATADGKTLMDLAWTKNATYDVMIVHRPGAASTAPTQGTTYNIGDSCGSGTVIYKGSGSSLEHMVASGTEHHYAFYSVNNNHYSAGLTDSETTEQFAAQEIVDTFSYTNGTTLANCAGSNDWSGAWSGNTGWVTNHAGSFSGQTNYPTPTGNKIVMVPSNNAGLYVSRSFAARTSGKVYAAFIMNFTWDGAQKWAGASLMHGATEKIFFGECWGASATLGVHNAVSTKKLDYGSGNDYVIIMRYDFSTDDAHASAYKIGADSVPDSEPGSWDAEYLNVGGVTQIDGISLRAGASEGYGTPGVVYFDEVRVATNWSELLAVVPSKPEDPVSASATADGNEMVRLGWEKNGAGNGVMILYKTSAISTDPTDGTTYSLNDTIDGATVIYKGTGDTLEHVVADGSSAYYQFYSYNAVNYYSTGLTANVTMGSYQSYEIVNPFSYTNATAPGTATKGGKGFGDNYWAVSGSWGIRTNSPTAEAAAIPRFVNIEGYTDMAGNLMRITGLGNGSSGYAERSLGAAINSGQIYVAFMMAYQYYGSNKWAGLSFYNGATEKAFFGKASGANWYTLGVAGDGGTAWSGYDLRPYGGGAEAHTGSVYLVLGKYDFSTKNLQANAYNLPTATEFPSSEPTSWDVTRTLGTGIDSVDRIRLNVGALNPDCGSIGDVYFDEIRLATNWSQLVGVTCPTWIGSNNVPVAVTNLGNSLTFECQTYPIGSGQSADLQIRWTDQTTSTYSMAWSSNHNNNSWWSYSAQMTKTGVHDFVYLAYGGSCSVISTNPSGSLTVNALVNPNPVSATRDSVNTNSQINLAWTKNTVGHDVMIVRNTSGSFTAPTPGTAYYAGETLGSDTVVYRGNASSFDDTGLASSQTYYYRFYSENYSYYSTGTVDSASTLGGSQAIVVDGNPADWQGTAGSTYNASTVSRNEFIWKDKCGEERKDVANTTNADIREVRIYADTTNVYFLVKYGDVTSDQHPYINIGLDTRRSSASGAMNWIGDDSGTFYGGNYFAGGQAAVHYAQRNITVHRADGAMQVEVYADDGGTWYGPPAGSAAAASAANNAMEFWINRSDLLVSSPVTARFTVASFLNNDLWNNSGDGTVQILAGTPDAADAASIAPEQVNDGDLSQSAWQEDISDNSIDFWFDVVFDANGVVANSIPSTPAVGFPTNNYAATANPTLWWNASTDSDGQVTGYFLEVGTNETLNGESGTTENGSIFLRVNLPATQTNYTLSTSATQYWWRVRARDTAGALSSGQIQMFRIGGKGDITGPLHTLLYIGTNLTGYLAGDFDAHIDKYGPIQSITDAEIQQAVNAIGFAIKIEDPSGVYATNRQNNSGPAPSNFTWNIVSDDGRVSPNWDVFRLYSDGSSNELGYDAVFYGSNIASSAGNSSPSITAWVHNAFTISGYDETIEYYLTVSSEDGCTENGSWAAYGSWNSYGAPAATYGGYCEDGPNTARNVSTNELIRINVTDDDDDVPTFAYGAQWASSRTLLASNATALLTASGSGQSVIYTGTDGGMTGTPLTLLFNAYDYYSGLQLSAAGSADTNTSLSVGSSSWQTNNIANYSASRSTVGDTTETNTVLAWHWDSLAFSDMTALWAGDGSGSAGETNPVMLTLRDTDHDRTDDASVASNVVFGYLQVTDDDSVAPSHTQFTIDGVGGYGSTNLLPGNIAVVGVNGSPSAKIEKFAFVVLAPFPAGTIVHFTDCGWADNAGTNWHRVTEFHTNLWIATGDADVGQVFELGLQDINSGGDQVTVYQYNGSVNASNDPDRVTFLYAVNMLGTNTAPQADGWYLPIVPTNNLCSALYRGLTNGVTAVSVGGAESVNIIYTGRLTGSSSELLASISDSNNWQVAASATDLNFSNFAFSVTSQGGMEWQTPNLTDAQVSTGQYTVVDVVSDYTSGLLATNNAYASAPHFLLYNADGDMALSNAMSVGFPNGVPVTTQALTRTASTGMWNYINIGTYSAVVYVTDFDFDRLNDNQDGSLAMPVAVTDDDADAPLFTNLTALGTGAGLTENGTMVLYDFDIPVDETTYTFTTNADTVVAHVTAGAVLGGGVDAINQGTGNPGYCAVTSKFYQAYQYLDFTLTVESGYALTVTNLTFMDNRSSTGPTDWYFLYSGDSYATALASGNHADTNWKTNSTALSLSSLEGAVTFRLHATNATGSTGSWRVDNLRLQGSLAPLPGSGLVSDQDLNQGTLSITARVTDATSGVYSNRHPTYGTRFDLVTPAGASLFNQQPFNIGPTNASQTIGEWANLYATNLSVAFANIVLGVHTASVYAADADNDRPDDNLQYTQQIAVTVIDDDTNPPVGGTIFQSMTKDKPFDYPNLHGPMVLYQGTTNASAAGVSTNRRWSLNDRMMQNVGSTNTPYLHINLYDESGYHRSGTEALSNLTLTIEGFITNDVSYLSLASSSASTTNNPAATNVWVFTSFGDMSFVGTTSKVTVSVSDTDKDRPDDASVLTAYQVGYIAWKDNDPSPAILQFPTNQTANTNALTVLLGPSPGAPTSNLWTYSTHPEDASNQVYAVSDGELAGVSGSSQLMLGFHSYDLGDDNVLGLQRDTTATTTSDGRTLTNTHISIGSVVSSNTANYSSGWSSSIGETRIAAQNATSYWAFTTFTSNQVGQFWDAAGHSNAIVLHALDSDNDRPGDQARTNLNAGWLVVYDDDTNAPTAPTALSVSPTDWTNANSFTLSFTDSSDASGILHYRYDTNAPASLTNGTEMPVSRIITGVAEGEITNRLFAVDADHDRAFDGQMSETTNFVTRLDQHAPPQIMGITVDEGEDPTTEVELNWTAAANAGNRPDGATLSPWNSYRIYFSEDGSTVTTSSAYFDGYTGQAALTNMSVSTVTLSNLIFGSDYKFRIVGRDRAGNEGPLSDEVVIVLPGFNVTQGLVKATSGDIRYSEIFWVAATNQSGGVNREYDLLWVDGSSFNDGMSNQWQFLQSGFTNSLSDTGGLNRTAPTLLTSNMRFYRAASKDRWMTNRSPRVASEEVYGLRTVTLYPGQNWVGLPVVPDSNTLKNVLGHYLPGGSAYTDPHSTIVTWYSRLTNETVQKDVYLLDWGSSNEWRTGQGWGGMNQVADHYAFPFDESVAINIPTNETQTYLLMFIGRVPTNNQTQVIQPNGAYNLVNMRLPCTMSPAQMNLLASGFKGGVGSMSADRIRKLNRQQQGVGFDVYYNTTRSRWEYVNNSSAAGFTISPDDGFLIWTRGSTTPWTWTNVPPYSLPTRLMNP